MIMLKTIDPEIRKLSAVGMYYQDIAEKLGIKANSLLRYMEEKGIDRNLKDGRGRKHE